MTPSAAEQKLWDLTAFLEKLSPAEKTQYQETLGQLFTQLKQQANYQDCLNHFKEWLKNNTEFRDRLGTWRDRYSPENEIPQQHWDDGSFLENVCRLEQSLIPPESRELTKNDEKKLSNEQNHPESKSPTT